MAVDVMRKDWHVLIKTRNGTVSLVRNLSLHEAAQVYGKYDPHQAYGGYSVVYPQDSDTVQRDIIGPDGWDGCLKGEQHNFGDWGEPSVGRRVRSCQACGGFDVEELLAQTEQA